MYPSHMSMDISTARPRCRHTNLHIITAGKFVQRCKMAGTSSEGIHPPLYRVIQNFAPLSQQDPRLKLIKVPSQKRPRHPPDIPRRVGKSREMSGSVGKCREKSGNVGKSREMSGNDQRFYRFPVPACSQIISFFGTSDTSPWRQSHFLSYFSLQSKRRREGRKERETRNCSLKSMKKLSFVADFIRKKKLQIIQNMHSSQ